MTVLGRYLFSTGQTDLLESVPAFDEFAGPDGTVRPGWGPIVDTLDGADLRHARGEVARLLADDGVTYTPGPASAISIVEDAPVHPDRMVDPQPWRLDPLPLVLHEREWASLEAGVVQRADLLDAIMADLYGAQQLLAQRRLPTAAVLDHEEYLRAVVDVAHQRTERLFMVAVDLGRDAAGAWKVVTDRTQAPSGAGFAMQNRRVVSRVLPEVYHRAHLHRLTPFFHAMRMALVDAAPPGVEDPRVVVLSPGTHSETAFDQAFLASLLGFPLLEGSDLTVRDGRVWMRVLGRLEQVDVILRRVDSRWSDPLELIGRSRLGVAGLLGSVRRGTVSVVNNLGSGVLENPALLPYLPDLCLRLLGQPLRLPSVDTWWGGDPAGLSHLLTHLDRLVIRPISRGQGRSVLGGALSDAQRQRLVAKIQGAPHRFVGQEVLPLSSAPTSEGDGLVRRSVTLRAFAVRSGASYAAMMGGLARLADPDDPLRGALVTPPEGGVAKDVWIVSSTPVAPAKLAPRTFELEPALSTAASSSAAHSSAAMVPRVLSDLFWFGRYAERAEDLLRLVLAVRTAGLETDLDTTRGRALQVLLQAVTHISTTYPGFLDPDAQMWPELRALLLDRHRTGTAAQSLGALSTAAQGVRDQLSNDVWMVLAETDRALAALSANPYDRGLQLTEASERVLSGLLALSGIVSENMVRDPGWFMLDSGRGLERALQVVALLRVTLCTERAAVTERLVTEAVLSAAESIVTFRRRYRGRTAADAVVKLLVLDAANPRSVAYQLQRILLDLQAIPNTSPTARPLRIIERLTQTVRGADLVELAVVSDGQRTGLATFLTDLHTQLSDLSEAIRVQYQQRPPNLQPLVSTFGTSGFGASGFGASSSGREAP